MYSKLCFLMLIERFYIVDAIASIWLEEETGLLTIWGMFRKKKRPFRPVAVYRGWKTQKKMKTGTYLLTVSLSKHMEESERLTVEARAHLSIQQMV